MNSSKNILLASHGTDGAQAAERMATALCTEHGHIHHLFVVPDLWKGMMGDDWLNNRITRDRFGRYLESELGREIDEHCSRVQDQAEERGLRYTCDIMLGKPEKCLLNVSRNASYDLIIMGSPRPKGIPGLRSRMSLEPLVRGLAIPLLIAPYPDD
ncbi:MAG: universal stress protein [Gammaproteobacteria bacterium]|nr:MAG: universal stress protein [Gammaproteobacteria bacterium]